VEQKIEVVPGRVYIHSIPQWLDNVGYLIVCLPRPKTEQKSAVKITVEDDTDPIVAVMIDCGEAQATVRAVELIQKFHYGKRNVQIQSILSTHKHHDHTGGNGDLLKHQLGSKITRVYAGAVEKVPHCSHPLTNGEKLVLPQFQANDMNELVEIEAVAVPAHTRGSLVYRLRSKASDHVEFMFTGDTMFSAGGGVPFESDTGTETDAQINRSNGNTFIRTSIGNSAMERCFAEILSRALPNDHAKDAGDRILIFPGHEYTSELLNRQLQGNLSEACRWKMFAPKYFFETVSQMYVAQH
jgi:glyoxylase-like metal-dependent hydrolase (beta-lactamase superfamily II)